MVHIVNETDKEFRIELGKSSDDESLSALVLKNDEGYSFNLCDVDPEVEMVMEKKLGDSGRIVVPRKRTTNFGVGKKESMLLYEDFSSTGKGNKFFRTDNPVAMFVEAGLDAAAYRHPKHLIVIILDKGNTELDRTDDASTKRYAVNKWDICHQEDIGPIRVVRYTVDNAKWDAIQDDGYRIYLPSDENLLVGSVTKTLDDGKVIKINALIRCDKDFNVIQRVKKNPPKPNNKKPGKKNSNRHGKRRDMSIYDKLPRVQNA